MNRIAFGALAVVAGLSAATTATAQDINTTLSYRIGFVYPLEDSVRDFTGNMASVGVDIETEFSLIKGSVGYLSADYIFGAIDGGKGKFIPIMWNQRFGLSQGLAGRDTYFFVGAGFVNVDAGNSARFRYGLRGGIGVRLSEKQYFEATYLWSDDASGVRANSLGFSIGFRF